MPFKVAFVILALGAAACVLLVARQQRLQAVHDLAVVEQRIAELDRTRWRLRVEIAQATAPDRVERLARNLGQLQPIIVMRPNRPVTLAAADEDPRSRAAQGATP